MAGKFMALVWASACGVFLVAAFLLLGELAALERLDDRDRLDRRYRRLRSYAAYEAA